MSLKAWLHYRHSCNSTIHCWHCHSAAVIPNATCFQERLRYQCTRNVLVHVINFHFKIISDQNNQEKSREIKRNHDLYMQIPVGLHTRRLHTRCVREPLPNLWNPSVRFSIRFIMFSILQHASVLVPLASPHTATPRPPAPSAARSSPRRSRSSCLQPTRRPRAS